jgi:hypothetical protein
LHRYTFDLICGKDVHIVLDEFSPEGFWKPCPYTIASGHFDAYKILVFSQHVSGSGLAGARSCCCRTVAALGYSSQ